MVDVYSCMSRLDLISKYAYSEKGIKTSLARAICTRLAHFVTQQRPSLVEKFSLGALGKYVEE